MKLSHISDFPIIKSDSSMAWATRVQSQAELFQSLKYMVFHTTLLNTELYKVWIKSKWVRAIEKRAFGLRSTTVFNFTYFIDIKLYVENNVF